MKKHIYFSNEELLQNARVLFDTLEKNTTIAEKIDSYGYSSKEIAEGKKLFTIAETQYHNNLKETEKEKIAYIKFKEKFDEITQLYKEHRNKAKLIFKDNESAKLSLFLKGSPAKAIPKILEEMTAFYFTLNQEETLLNPLERLKITKEISLKQYNDIKEIKKLYTTYAQRKNESEQATKDKNDAFEDLDKWMRELYQYSKYALEKEPQFLQIFGRIVP